MYVGSLQQVLNEEIEIGKVLKGFAYKARMALPRFLGGYSDHDKRINTKFEKDVIRYKKDPKAADRDMIKFISRNDWKKEMFDKHRIRWSDDLHPKRGFTFSDQAAEQFIRSDPMNNNVKLEGRYITGVSREWLERYKNRSVNIDSIDGSDGQQAFIRDLQTRINTGKLGNEADKFKKRKFGPDSKYTRTSKVTLGMLANQYKNKLKFR